MSETRKHHLGIALFLMVSSPKGFARSKGKGATGGEGGGEEAHILKYEICQIKIGITMAAVLMLTLLLTASTPTDGTTENDIRKAKRI